MKILLISKWVDGSIKGSFHHSGEWADTFELACSFEGLGHDVSIITPQVYQTHIKTFKREFGNFLEKKKIDYIMANTILEYGKNEAIFQWRMQKAALEVIKDFKPDVIQYMQLTPTFIHFFTKVPIFFYGIVIDYEYPKLEEDTKARLTSVNKKRNPWYFFTNAIYYSLVRLFGYQQASRLTPIGCVVLKHPQGYKKIRKSTTSKEKVFLVHKGVEFKKSKRASLESVRILFVGSITHRKGIFDLLEVFEDVQRNFPQAKLKVAGDGPRFLVSKAKKFAKRKRFNVQFLGSVGYAKKWILYKNSDIFCLPTYADASPAVVLEAMSCGLPVITTYESDSPIRNLKEGILFKAGDKDGLKKAITRLLLDKNLRRKIGNNEREKVKEYNWQNQAEKLVKIYQKNLLRAKNSDIQAGNETNLERGRKNRGL